MANKTVGDLNFKVGADTSGVVSGLAPAMNAWKAYKQAADAALKPGKTPVNATALASVEREKQILAQITGVTKAGAYDSSRLEAFSQSAIVETRNLGNTADDSQKKYARFGVVMQQAGYQMQDFAVQVAGGQNALVALSQQGSQMLGVFGVGGAIAGAVLAVGVLGARMIGLGESTKQAVASAKEAGAAWESFAKKAKEIKFGNLTSEGQQQDIQKQIEAEKKKQSVLLDLQTRFGGIGAEMQSSYGAIIGGVIVDEYADYTKYVFPTLDQQLKYLKAIEKAKIDGAKAPSPLEDRFGGGALSILNPSVGGNISSLLNQIEEQTGKGSENLLDLQNKLTDFAKQQAKLRFENIASEVATESEAKASAVDRFQQARKQNALMEMGTEEQLAYYQREIQFLDSIGAKKTEEYELAKKRVREIGSILLGQSGFDNIDIDAITQKRDRIITGLQARMPESLRVNDGNGFSYGQSVGGRGADILDLTRRMLNALEKLVELERYDLNPI